MSDYDFRPLNDKEFEIFCIDLIGDNEGKRFDRFKPGKDGGVDGRFFASNGTEVVLQCKHWLNTPTKQLINRLIKEERPKLDKLKPGRYILAVSNPLSRADKKALHRAFAPYLLTEDDIFGQENLNDLLKQRPIIERRHYKLWLHTTSVLAHILNNAIFGRSEFSLSEIVESSSRYVITDNHAAALNILQTLGILIITGEPGVGKTTLANHLCLHYVTEGYQYLKIDDDIREAESVFDSNTKQIIYFDDFLGSNYLDALRGHEGSITLFMRRVAANRNKRLVLTSRSTILNQGKQLIASLEHQNIQRNEYELRIQSLADFDKAKILYNYIWHSGLSPEYIGELYIDKHYRTIISHRNFNPRLISYITDPSRLTTCPHNKYWDYIAASLSNPAQVWENPFTAQQDDFGRAIILLVVLNGHPIPENILADTYHRYLGLPENTVLHGRHDYLSNIKLLTGSFLNRLLSPHLPAMINLFNPSIADYVLTRYSGDVNAVKLGMLALKTWHSVLTLRNLKRDGRLSPAAALSICETILANLAHQNFAHTTALYVTSLCMTYIMCGGSINNTAMQAAVLFILASDSEVASDESFDVIRWAVRERIISPGQAIDFLEASFEDAASEEEIGSMVSLLLTIPESTIGHPTLAKKAKNHIVESLAENLESFIATDSAFSRVDDYGDYDKANDELMKLVEEKFDEFGIPYDSADVFRALEDYDVADGLDSYFKNSFDGDDRTWSAPAVQEIDEIDDLFERT
ncbi:MAG: restriction endonuclease [Sulfuricella sp.]|nr:restriction endonuclease [Sulfuricella sp.]